MRGDVGNLDIASIIVAHTILHKETDWQLLSSCGVAASWHVQHVSVECRIELVPQRSSLAHELVAISSGLSPHTKSVIIFTCLYYIIESLELGDGLFMLISLRTFGSRILLTMDCPLRE